MANDCRTELVGRCLVGEIDEAIENATQWPTVSSVFYPFRLSDCLYGTHSHFLHRYERSLFLQYDTATRSYISYTGKKYRKQTLGSKADGATPVA